MKFEIEKLRKYMLGEGLDAYLVNSSDFHGSEYVQAHFRFREFLTGFTGSNGTLVVTAREARLWTDSRYFEQAEIELADSGIELMKMGEEGVPTISTWLSLLANERAAEEVAATPALRLGLDARTVTFAFMSELRRAARRVEPVNDSTRKQEGVCSLKRELEIIDIDLAREVWAERPEMTFEKVWVFESVADAARKIQSVRYILENTATRGATCLVTADLTEIAWMLGLRGTDIEYNPVFYAYLILTPKRIFLFANETSFDEETRKHLGKLGVQLEPYDNFYENAPENLGNQRTISKNATENLCSQRTISKSAPEILRGQNVLLTPDKVTQRIYTLVSEVANVVMAPAPITKAKAIKSPLEVSRLRAANIADGVAMTKFIYWIKNAAREAGAGALTEIAAARYLDELRRSYGAMMPSFETIMAYGAHSSIVHYSASESHAQGGPEPNARTSRAQGGPEPKNGDNIIRPEGILLVDSGGQYMGQNSAPTAGTNNQRTSQMNSLADTPTAGTTDVTRTIALGPVTPEMKHAYTLVLQGHIDLAMARFPEGTTGAALDPLARKYLWDEGLDFGHGTGHGIGFALSVHEGPQGIHKRANAPFVPGMVTSDEPGVYFPGKFGIRIENDLLCVEKKDWTTFVLQNSKHTPMYEFENLTLVPYEPELIEWERLSDEQRIYLKTYNERLVEELGPYLEDEELSWLEDQVKS